MLKVSDYMIIVGLLVILVSSTILVFYDNIILKYVLATITFITVIATTTSLINYNSKYYKLKTCSNNDYNTLFKEMQKGLKYKDEDIKNYKELVEGIIKNT